MRSKSTSGLWERPFGKWLRPNHRLLIRNNLLNVGHRSASRSFTRLLSMNSYENVQNQPQVGRVRLSCLKCVISFFLSPSLSRLLTNEWSCSLLLSKMPVADRSLFSCLRNVWLSKSRFRIEMTLHDFLFVLSLNLFLVYNSCLTIFIGKPLCIFPLILFSFHRRNSIIFRITYNTSLLFTAHLFFLLRFLLHLSIQRPLLQRYHFHLPRTLQ